MVGHPQVVPEPVLLKARLLGPSEISIGDRLLTSRDWPGRKARSLLLLLLGTRDHRLHRDQVLDLLWPEHDIDAGTNALYKALHALRRTFEPDLRTGRSSQYIQTRGEMIGLSDTSRIWVDVEQFAHLLDLASVAPAFDQRVLLRNALGLCRGEFVADELYADWPITRREALRADRERATLTLARLDAEAGEPLATVPYLEALLAEDPALELAHRALMHTYLAGGERSLALRQFERCRELLNTAYDSEPELETVRLADSIRKAPETAAVDVHNLAAARHGSLPSVPTRTIGRDNEIGELGRLLVDSTVRLVTITGTGGIGKTRLATEVASSVKASFPDGAGFVALAAIRDISLLFDAISRTLRIPENPNRATQDVVSEYLQGRTCLLVLDNLEQLAGAGPPIAELLEACPHLTILVTSREPLRIRAERLYRLDVLGLPDATTASSNDALAGIASTAMFLQSMTALHYGYQPSPADAPAIAELCIRLDGLPLAIELAAARCYDLTPAEVLAQLKRRTRIVVLRDGPRDLPERHRTLHDLVLWSHDLLTEQERVLFRRLAVFAGGIELDALEAIGGENAMPLANALADKSLVQWTHTDGVRRLVMLETIREVAVQVLAESGEDAAVWDATTGFYVSLSSRAYEELYGPDQLSWYDRLQRDLNTIRAVLARALERAPEDALAIAGHLSPFWFYRQHTTEGIRWLEQALSSVPKRPTPNRLVAAIGAAQCFERSGDYDTARQFSIFAREAAITLEDRRGYAAALRISATHAFRDDVDIAIQIISEALEISRELDDAHGIGHCLVGVSLHRKSLHDFAGAIHALEEALDTAQRSGNQMLKSYVLMHLANTVYQSGNMARAAAIAKECERSARIADNRLSLPWSLFLQMLVACEEKRYTEGLALAREASTLFAEVGDRRSVAVTRTQCGMLETCLGNHEAAAGHILAAIPEVQRYGYESDKHDCLMEAGLLANATGQCTEALTLYAANDVFRDQHRSPGDQARFDGAVAAVRAGLDPAPAGRAWDAGLAMCLDDALSLAEDLCRRHVTAIESVA